MSPILFIATLLAQVPSTSQASSPPPRLSLTAAYLGEEVFHPGGQLGLEYVLARHAWLELVGGVNLGGYAHYRYATGLYLDAAVGARATMDSGFLVEVLGDVGYLHLFPYGAIYQVPSGGGAPTQVANLGRPALRFGGTLGLGVELSRTRLAWPLAVTLRVGAFGEAQLGGGVQAPPEALACVSWRL
jgi:hypothetical protein